jgi:RimJ/RimL family protein N-acetyltransferase
MNTHIISLTHPKLEKVYLRPLEKADLPLCCRWINNPEIRQYLANQNLPSLQKEEGWYDSLQKSDKDLVLVITDKSNHAPLGTIGLSGIDWRNHFGTTGALIGEKEYWGKGYGTEAKLLLLKHAFDTLGLEKIGSSVLGNNPRSKAYLEKTGYHEEGCRQRHYLVNGKKVDDYIMAIFREDFEPVWKKYCGE